jgi:hypothetical protein
MRRFPLYLDGVPDDWPAPSTTVTTPEPQPVTLVATAS